MRHPGNRPSLTVVVTTLLSTSLVTSLLIAADPPTSPPIAALKDGWTDVDQRMVFLTVQLSTTETLLAANNKGLRVNGYAKAIREADAQRARLGNQLMDRNGGGPVPWQEFYGKTAERFFYHPVDGSSVHLDPLPIDQRPLQAAMDAEGIDYLLVDSNPITTAVPGTRYYYKISTRSKRGSVTMDLQSSPPGMTLTDGILTWNVPASYRTPSATIIVAISDASGQTIYHTFTVNTLDYSRKR